METTFSTRIVLTVAMTVAVLCSCKNQHTKPDNSITLLSKINFDLGAINDEGLTGPPDGLVSVDYEFCIPDKPECLRDVKSIDPKVKFLRGSRGRIGCGPNQVLCIGSTYQKNFREVLCRLAELDYIERIDRCFWE